jgi:hypothetical protein
MPVLKEESRVKNQELRQEGVFGGRSKDFRTRDKNRKQVAPNDQ